MRVLHVLDVRDADVVRHVVDIAAAQSAQSHAVGIICGDAEGDRLSLEKLAKLSGVLALDLRRIPMNRNVTLADLSSLRTALAAARVAKPDILHGHGQKGGAFARIIGSLMRGRGLKVQVIYNPHGQTLDGTDQVSLPLTLEKRLLRSTAGIIFESQFEKAQYERRFGRLPNHAAVIPYGISEAEFTERQIIDTATDFLYVGDLRRSKGIDVLVMALARMKRNRLIGALIIGDGEEERELRRQVDRYGLAHQVFFNAAIARELAFLKGSCLVVPARSESCPRIVLEAAVVGMPMILTNAGGIPEIVGKVAMPLIAPNDVEALVKQLNAFLDDPKPFINSALDLKQRVAEQFTARRMTEATAQFYAQVAGQ